MHACYRFEVYSSPKHTCTNPKNLMLAASIQLHQHFQGPNCTCGVHKPGKLSGITMPLPCSISSPQPKLEILMTTYFLSCFPWQVSLQHISSSGLVNITIQRKSGCFPQRVLQCLYGLCMHCCKMLLQNIGTIHVGQSIQLYIINLQYSRVTHASNLSRYITHSKLSLISCYILGL